MQNIFIERPYQFLGPFRSTILPRIIRDAELFRWHLRKNEGVGSVEVRNADNLKASLDAGKGVLLTPNHPRTADPIVLGSLAKEVRCYFYAMASSHLFHNGWKNRFLIRVMGGFSVNREGSDRQAINTAIDAMVEAKRPLIVFGEGTAMTI